MTCIGRQPAAILPGQYSDAMPERSQSLRTRSHLSLLGSACAIALIPLAVASQGTAAVAKTPTAQLQRHVALIGLDPLWVNQTGKVIAQQIAAMKAIGIGSVRIDANWRAVQPRGPRSFAWKVLDREVGLARAAHLSVTLIIDDCPTWAAISGARHRLWAQPRSTQQYAAFAAHVARRYAAKGVKFFEIWNEPNDAKFFQPKSNPAAYTRMLVAAYKAIKRTNKSAFVISGGLAPVPTRRGSVSPIAFLKAMYAHGAKGHFDALGDHAYSFPALPNTFKTWSSWSQMSQTHPSLRSVMASHGDSRKRIWITEYGAPSGGPGGVSQKAQATDMTQAIIDARTKNWIGAIDIYTWQDLGTDRHTRADWFGLLTFSGKRKPAYYAVKLAIKLPLP